MDTRSKTGKQAIPRKRINQSEEYVTTKFSYLVERDREKGREMASLIN